MNVRSTTAAPQFASGNGPRTAPAHNVFLLRLSMLFFAPFLPVVSPALASSSKPAQTPAPTQAARQIGTVKSIAGSTLALTTDAGQSFTVTVIDGARILQLAPGSTSLAAAQAISLTDIAVGDRVLVTGKPGDAADSFSASRVILMKATDLAQKHAAEEADWQKRGSGGLVSSVDPASGVVTITVRGKSVAIQTGPATVFRRYASDSVKFEDATKGTLAQIQPGDQLRVRGNKSEDGSSIQGEEIVSGSFKNLAGTIASVNATAGTLTLKDLATKKTYTVSVTANSNLRTLPPEIAARFAARAKGEQAGATPAAGSATANARSASAGGGMGGGASGAYGQGERRPGGSAGMDLSQMLPRLPEGSLATLHSGDAVMVVASGAQPGSDALTAVTLLSGVEPILAATPSGSAAMTLSPWSVGNAQEMPAQ